ncbi:hypothetical protein CC1G_14709 [Coprinopsis cinerea okayama7|uniref:Uncharacterized protein n=1 Tax=Coprinopsis cinerea (strain Okayama-7 / 130 / ATCC MYA-4618 / FGSC 9003) TaxID=240176 RepID=D6RMT4_COPC7|nr:hypothetical protein CC1G_14709 [Coprinopsis cinerea okayama7\|eukprot:XP_002911280.1 hypothetical protein CC1G_14709 [Coprinopsis cinerea okayama7\
MPITSTTSSPPEGFIPRKEFLRDQHPRQPNSFALLALSSSNFIRLYSFGQQVEANLRRLFENHGVPIATREDTHHGLYEFSLDGKPWANPKSVATEKLLVDIFAIIYQAGYSFLSSIDYGREHDDRLAMVFSKPSATPEASRTGTPLPPGGSPFLGANTTVESLPKPTTTEKRVPFALSFASTTLMRVIAPPLHLTPAILQAVRAAWPRGVVYEQKVGENSFEFKLKGYKWFEQDNFASDSLQCILSLLTSLDAHSFTLLTSLSLTNRSKVKDLWIFTGLVSDSTSSHEETSFSLEHSESHRSMQHRRQVSEPPALPTQSGSQPHGHTRAATEDMSQFHRQPSPPTTSLSQGPHLLRKPAPRAQVPVSVIQENDPDVDDDAEMPGGYDVPVNNRVNLPSVISNGQENMTGVGAGGYQYPPFDPNFRVQSVKDRPKTPPLLSVSSSPSTSPQRSPHRHETGGSGSRSPSRSGSQSGGGSPNAQGAITPSVIPPLLGGNAFKGDSDEMYRNSTLSTQTGSSDISSEIPIKWTGAVGGERPANRHKVPGGWQGTSSPIDEEDDPFANTTVNSRWNFPMNSPKPEDGGEQEKASTPIHETSSRVESPEILTTRGLRRSEAALVGVIAATSLSPSSGDGSGPSTPPRHSDGLRNSASRNSGRSVSATPVPPHVQTPPMKSSSSLGSSSGHGQGKEKDGKEPRESRKLVKPNTNSANSGASSGGGQGWVLVNVEGQTSSGSRTATPQMASHTPAFVSGSAGDTGGSIPTPIANLHATTLNTPPSSTSAAAPAPSSASPNTNSPSPVTAEMRAKAIVIVDALETSKGKKAESIASTDTKDTEGKSGSMSGVRRFFSLNKKNSRRKLSLTATTTAAGRTTHARSPSLSAVEGTISEKIEEEEGRDGELRAVTPKRPKERMRTFSSDKTDETTTTNHTTTTTTTTTHTSTTNCCNNDNDNRLTPTTSTTVNPTTIPRSLFRDRLRRFGTPQVSRREDRRKSID